MAYVIAYPEVLAAAATDVNEIGSAIRAVTATAAGATTKLMTMANDEVSRVVSALFSGYAEQYQQIIGQAAAFHDEFARALSAAGSGYASAEGANAGTMARAAALPAADTFALLMGKSNTPIPDATYVSSIDQLFIQPLHLGAISQALDTPAELFPTSGVHNLTFDKSVSEGITILDNAITQQITAGNNVVAFGFSQSATAATLEMSKLAALPAALRPSTDQLSFVLVGDPNNPNGGIFERFNGANLSTVGMTFSGATPDNIYPTSIFTTVYDGYADFPRYPINLISDVNALFGIYYVHTAYPDLTSAQVSSAVHLQTQGPTLTDYYMIATDNLPLLQPLRALPIIGNPLADLLQPDLKVIVNLGYGDPNFGYSTSPANVPTGFGLFPHVAPATILGDLATGTQQGVSNFSTELGSSLSAASTSALSGVASFNPVAAVNSLATTLSSTSAHSIIEGLKTLNTGIANAASTIISSNSSLFLPTADLVTALAFDLPSYDVNLFLNGVSDAINGNAYGLVEAIGYPVAANTGLVSLAAFVEAEVLLHVVEDDVGALLNTG